MPALLMTAPILPDKLESWRRFVADLLGERVEQYRAAIRNAGLERLRVWEQKGPDGSDAAVVVFEGPAPERFLGGIATGDDDFSAWFRTGLSIAHGIDLSLPPPPPPVLVIDEQVRAAFHTCSTVRVHDVAGWLAVMQDLRPLRIEHGQVSEEILRNEKDEHEFTVLLGWRDEERAKQYYRHPDLRAGVERSGGVEGRGVTFLVRP